MTNLALHCEIEGYYKDVFMDGGVSLTSRTALPAADSLGLSLEFLSTENLSWQTGVIIESSTDENGWLLYPDGAPRFRLIYTNGGNSANHGYSLGEIGRERIRTFYNNGGSYTGSCAGAYIASLGYNYPYTVKEYYHIWPGWTDGTNISDSYVDHVIPADSPLLKYYDFGSDSMIESVYYNNGCYADERELPAGTESLLLMNGKINCWSYKENDNSGRLIVTGSHPEGQSTGEVLHLMMAILQYALEGQGKPCLKADLNNGEQRLMNKASSDSIPDYTKIGDRQYHHYRIYLPYGSNILQINLDGDDAYDFNLFLKKDDFAFAVDADYEVVEPGANKQIQLDNLPKGEYYIGVKCINTVTSIASIYIGDLSVLNGVEYSISASWEESAASGIATIFQPHEYQLNQNYPNPFNPVTTISYELPRPSNVTVTVYDVRGRVIETLVNQPQQVGIYQVLWNASNYSSGVYFYRIETPEFSKTKQMILLK